MTDTFLDKVDDFLKEIGEEIKEIIDAAIKHVDKKNISHFMDVLLGKRYDNEDCIVLREKDFIIK